MAAKITISVQKKPQGRGSLLLVYTALFAIAAGFTLGMFRFYGRSMIWDPDGWDQHYPALIYYSRWLRTIAKELLVHHRLSVPTYSFSIGYGADILTTLSYYVIGDPFTIFSALVPVRYIRWYYDGMIVFRAWASGAAFLMFLDYMRRRSAKTGAGNVSRTAMIAAALIYSLNGFAIVGMKHPYFLNPIIWFPLLLLGVEKILDGKGPLPFIFAVFLASVSNFYFLYMLCILTLAYAIWKTILRFPRGQRKEGARKFAVIAGSALTGLAMSMLILLPTVIAFTQTGRVEETPGFPLHYTLYHYQTFLRSFLTGHSGSGKYTNIGCTGLGLTATALLFTDRGRFRRLKAAFIVLTVMLMVPAAGYAMNGFSYATNRWIWAYCLLLCYIIAVEWERFYTAPAGSRLFALAVIAAAAVYAVLVPRSGKTDTFLSLAVAAAALAAGSIGVPGIKNRGAHRRLAQGLLILLVLTNLIANVQLGSNPVISKKNLSQYIPWKETEVKNLRYASDYAVKKLDDGSEGFFRLSEFQRDRENQSLYSGMHTLQYYWSLDSRWTTQFMAENGITDTSMGQDLRSLDSRTDLQELANVKYHVNQMVPYGYEEVGSAGNDRKIYQNQYALPFGYTYDRWIPEKVFQDLSMAQKGEAMLQGIVLPEEYAPAEESEKAKESESQESESKGSESEESESKESSDSGQETEISLPETKLTLDAQEIPAQLTAGENVEISGSTYTVKKDNASVTLTFDGLPNSETYVLVSGLTYQDQNPRAAVSEKKWESMDPMDRAILLSKARGFRLAEKLTISFQDNASGQTDHADSITLDTATKESRYYQGRKDFLINLGYTEDAQNQITVQFGEKGKYHIDSLTVVCRPMDHYAEEVSALKQDTLQNVDLHENAIFATNEVTGDITLSQAKYLLVTIPYSKGWSAEVDGEPVQVLRANTMFSAVYLTPGQHHVVFRYHTPGLRAGLLLTALGWAIFVVLGILRRKRR